ncbi:MAG: FAD:protein FMN transferase [Lachnoclostridium sp.]
MKLKRLTCLISTLTLLLTGCSGLSAEPTTYTGTAFDSIIALKIYDKIDEDVLDHCITMCKDFENKFSRTIETSEIARINSSNGNPITVSDDTITLIKTGIYYGDLSEGAFDITIGTVSSLWDFKSEAPSVPSAEAIAEAISHVNYKNVEISGNTVALKDPEAVIDLGGIAKGYIADQLKKYLESQGVQHAMINLGGNVLAIGTKPDGTDYNIGITKPFSDSGEYITSIKIKDRSVVTSGTYQRYFKENGKLYHHILDPSTGYSCENGLSSVTIITDSSLDADALSTTCFVLGLDKGMDLINQLDGTDAIFITEDNQVKYSDNYQN